MAQEWWIEHIVEILSLAVTLAGFGASTFYLWKISITNNQRASMNGSPNSSIYQVITGSFDLKKIEYLKEISRNEVKSSDEPEKDPPALIEKIEHYLDENKPVSNLVEMALRLARKLDMKKDEEWLTKEAEGFQEYTKEEEEKTGLKLKKKDPHSEHRRIVGEIHIQTGQGQTEIVKIPMFISQSVNTIENWIREIRSNNANQMALWATPPQLMVETLNVDVKKEIPYILSIDSLDKIVRGVRSKIINFLNRARKS